MVNLTGNSNPTKRETGFVASEEARSRELRSLLAGLLRFARKERPLPGTTGEISLWICQLWGLASMRRSGAEVVIDGSYTEIAEKLQIFGPQLSPQKVTEKTARSKALQSSTDFKRMIEAAQQGDLAGLDEHFKKIGRSLIDLWMPGFEPPFELSVDVIRQIVRALRATLISTAVDHIHPVTLIAKAWKGDQQAVLALVRADKLFLQDRSTQAVIKNAALENDQQFMDVLARAQQWQPGLHRRDLLHIYFYVVFLLQAFGQPLPRIAELQRLLDPHGVIYQGPYAFERDLQRQRERFMKMVAEAYAELPALLPLYASDLRNRG